MFPADTVEHTGAFIGISGNRPCATADLSAGVFFTESVGGDIKAGTIQKQVPKEHTEYREKRGYDSIGIENSLTAWCAAREFMLILFRVFRGQISLSIA